MTEQPYDLVTTGEMAELLGLSRERVHQFIRDGRLGVKPLRTRGTRTMRPQLLFPRAEALRIHRLYAAGELTESGRP